MEELLTRSTSPALKARRILPGFRLTMGLSLLYLSLIVLIPLSTIVLKTATLSWGQFWSAVASPRALASYRFSMGASVVGALVNVLFGSMVAWVLVRYDLDRKSVV